MNTHAKKTNKHQKEQKKTTTHKHQKKTFEISFQYIDPTPYQALIKPLFRPYRNLF